MASDVWVLDVETGEQRVLTDGSLTAYSPAWSPDGSTIAFYAAPDMVTHGFRLSEVWTVSRQGGDQRSITASLDQACGFGIQPDYEWNDFSPPAWSPDGSTLYFTVNQGGDAFPYAADMASGALRRVSETPADVVSVTTAQDGKLLICLAATPAHPYDIYAVSPEGGELRPITNSNPDIAERRLLSAPEHITFKGPDGWDMEGWLYPPVGDVARPYPLVLHVHGGPFGAWGNTFYFQAQALAGKGYGSLYINPRGSTGYGYKFARAADWGLKDYEDLMAGVDAVIERGEADPRRLAITGISYGGFMTNWALGHTDRFVAGVSVNGVANFISMYGLSDMTSLWFELEMGGPFWASEENWQRYRFHSPISYVGNINTPMLFLQSENDFRCPIEEGEQMLTSLRMRRQKVELVRIPGASHVIILDGTPHQRYFQWKLAFDWFDEHVTGKAEAASAEEEPGVAVATVSVN
jgi:dipeptidyl aminopeptidase/acylaminoacyl peptidase